MEAPYRNKHALEALLDILPGSALLCVAWDLTMPTQSVVSQTVANWKKELLQPRKETGHLLFHIEG